MAQSVKTSIYVPKEHHDKLKAKAQEMGLSVNAIVNLLIQRVDRLTVSINARNPYSKDD